METEMRLGTNTGRSQPARNPFTENRRTILGKTVPKHSANFTETHFESVRSETSQAKEKLLIVDSV